MNGHQDIARSLLNNMIEISIMAAAHAVADELCVYEFNVYISNTQQQYEQY